MIEQHWLIRRKPFSTGWVHASSLRYWRLLGFGYYRYKGERPYLLLPGRPPKRNR